MPQLPPLPPLQPQQPAAGQPLTELVGQYVLPVPVSTLVLGHIGTDAGPRVMVLVEHPLGRTILFLDPDHCDKLAAGLRDAAILARSGLIVPNGHPL